MRTPISNSGRYGAQGQKLGFSCITSLVDSVVSTGGWVGGWGGATSIARSFYTYWPLPTLAFSWAGHRTLLQLCCTVVIDFFQGE